MSFASKSLLSQTHFKEWEVNSLGNALLFYFKMGDPLRLFKKHRLPSYRDADGASGCPAGLVDQLTTADTRKWGHD